MSRNLLLLLLGVFALLAGCASETPPADASDPDGAEDNAAGDTGEAPGVGDEAGEPPEPQTVVLSIRTSGNYPVDPGYSPSTLTAPEGAPVELTFTNEDAVPVVMHDWVLEGVDGAATDAIPPGESATVTFTAPAAGEYAFYCSVGDHRERGMEGTFTATPS